LLRKQRVEIRCPALVRADKKLFMSSRVRTIQSPNTFRAF
jgi:hypothetical protein